MTKSHNNPVPPWSGVTRTVLDELPVTVEAVLGIAQVRVGELTQLKRGDSFTLEQSLADPVELRLNGVTIAYGELVAVGENFGVRIEKIVSE